MRPTMGARPWHKAYEAGVPTALDLEALTVSQFLERAATDHGDATAIIYFNRRLTYRQLKTHVDRFAVVTDFLFESRIGPARARLPIEHYIVASIPDYMRLPLRILARWKLGRSDPPRVASVAPEPGVHSFMKLIRRTKPDSRTPARPETLAVLQYTGGTTALSKGAMLTHGNLAANLQQ